MILDTTVLIDFMKGNDAVRDKLAELAKKGEPKLITAISIFELHTGLSQSKNPSGERKKMLGILSNQVVLPFTAESAQKAGEIDGRLIKEGKRIGELDCMIAGIALLRKERVLTRNTNDFSKVNGLEIESY